ncbi:NHL repeat-containing protein [Desulfonema limicola]|uniref:NHL repeat-containing protein n=1 Tax=Desulfonema limicola TaxID=45656 RepID=A0A975B7T7_9BACT|nr:SMP-30/gluconolactonase/LRE family protein [Desulfonema limicola]QTA80470.1 NHL repeat-containing protein [Desulfonema limicola]
MQYFKHIKLKLLFFTAVLFILFPDFNANAETYKFQRMWPALQQPWYFSLPNGIAIDDKGFVYIADTGNHRIQKFTTDGHFIAKWGKQGKEDGEFDTPDSIALDNKGFVYVSDLLNSRIQKFSEKGEFIESWSGPKGEGFLPSGIAVDGGGFVYVVNLVNDLIYKFSDTGEYIAQWGNKGIEEHYVHTGIAVDNQGFVYAADRENHQVKKYSVTGELIKTWGQLGKENGSFDQPSGIAVDSDGYVYIADSYNDRVQKFTSDGEFQGVWGSLGTDDGQFNAPTGIAVDKNGFVFVSDWENQRIQKFSTDGRFVTGWKNRGSKPGEFYLPEKMTTDAAGNIYVADKGNHRIQKFDRDGRFVHQWGQKGSEPGQFNSPYGITADTGGNIFVADTLNNRIQKFSAEGTFIKQWGSAGVDEGQFDNPSGIAVDNNGFVYVADWENHRIQKFDIDGNFKAAWGSSGNGQGQFYRPFDLAVTDNAVYVSDTFMNCRIQKFDLNGKFITQWNTCDNSMSFSFSGIAADSSGAVYLTDADRHIIKKYNENGSFITSIGQPGSDAGQFKSPRFVYVSPDNTLYVSEMENNRIQAVQIQDSSEISKAIILAGGGPYTGNNLWDSTQMCANFAYRTLNYQGFGKDGIFYLTEDTKLDLDNNGEPDDVDAVPTNANLRDAITQWGKDAQTLVLYITDHGGDGIFRMSKNENLSASDLDLWLDELQNQTSAKIILIYDACESGSFLSQLTPPQGKERIILASTSPGESAYFVTQGSVSFSNYFWTDIFNGKDVFQAFKSAENAISLTMEYQHPLFDDNGDGISDASDSILAQKTYIGNATQISGENPIIGKVFPEQDISSTNTAILWADSVTDEDGIARVWAVIRPPGYTPGDSNNTVQSLPSVELLPEGAGRYEAVYEDFSFTGTYEIAVYARDSKGNTSAPAFTRVRVNDPQHRKAVIVAGGTQGDSLWPAVENNAMLAYESLKFQGYSDDDIYFLSSVSFSPGIDGLSSLSNLEFALGTWAENNTKDMLLYLIGNGEDKAFNLSQTEKLEADKLDKWLDTLQEKIPGEITIICDAPLSASFIPRLMPQEGKNRIFISSTSGIETANFTSNGDISFSQFFWNRIANGSSIYTAFVHAKNAIWFAAGTQTAQIEDNGNGIGNEKYDGILARKVIPGTGIFLTGNSPAANGISSNQSLFGQVTASIEIENINTTGEIEKVWAVINPPVEFQIPGESLENLPVIELDNSSGTFKGTYDNFTSYGDYKITAYVKDKQGNISEPLTSVITQETAPDVFEDDNTAFQAGYITLNAAGLSESFEIPGIQSHNFHKPGDEDWVQFYAVAGQPYVVETTNPGENTDTVITLFASDGITQIMHQDQWQDNLEGKGELLSWTCETDGMYYVRISHHDADVSGAGTGYDLKIYGPKAPLGGFVKGSITDANTGLPLTGAIITTDANASSVSRSNGRFLMIQEPGTFTLNINAAGYEPVTTLININDAGIAKADFKLVPIIPPEPEPVNFIPSGSIISPSSDLAVNAGESVDFQAGVISGDPPLSYFWDFDNGAENSNLLNPGYIIFNTPGTYNIKFTVTDFNGDYSMSGVKITVNEIPEPEEPQTDTDEPEPADDTTSPVTDDDSKPDIEIIQPLKPEIVYPGNGETDIEIHPVLETSPFIYSHDGYTHNLTRWQIGMDEEFSNIVLDIISAEYLTELPISDDILSYSSQYYWRVRFYDNQGNESQWSSPVLFYTAAPDNNIDDEIKDEPDDVIDQPEEPETVNEILFPRPPESEDVGGFGCFIDSAVHD